MPPQPWLIRIAGRRPSPVAARGRYRSPAMRVPSLQMSTGVRVTPSGSSAVGCALPAGASKPSAVAVAMAVASRVNDGWSDRTRCRMLALHHNWNIRYHPLTRGRHGETQGRSEGTADRRPEPGPQPRARGRSAIPLSFFVSHGTARARVTGRAELRYPSRAEPRGLSGGQDHGPRGRGAESAPRCRRRCEPRSR